MRRKTSKIWKKTSTDGKLQINMTAPEVNSWPKEDSSGALEPPSPQKPKSLGGALLTRIEEGSDFLFGQVRKYSVKNVPFKASVHIVEDQITREIEVESAKVILDNQVILNRRIMMLVILIDQFLEELQVRRHVRGMERAIKYALLNQIQIHQIIPK